MPAVTIMPMAKATGECVSSSGNSSSDHTAAGCHDQEWDPLPAVEERLVGGPEGGASSSGGHRKLVHETSYATIEYATIYRGALVLASIPMPLRERRETRDWSTSQRALQTGFSSCEDGDTECLPIRGVSTHDGGR